MFVNPEVEWRKYLRSSGKRIREGQDVRFIGDLHIHSHFSIATSRNLVPEQLEFWARMKGISLVGTGDFTHPGWLLELQQKLRPAEEGVFALRDELRIMTEGAPPSREMRFILSAEISSIYRKDDRVRKVHNLILVPDFETARKIQNRLSQIGNIESDGRPILGLDSRDLLELVLESSPRCFFIPSHIWTPWFSALGAKSGFDSIDACYADLSEHIRAVETGLSSDPPMNWLCSFLDRFTIISNSDAHSPEKLGREANLFDTALDYESVIAALSGRGSGFLGTIEFFPQEGKYHYDGHRKCGVRLNPLETLECGGICPVCGKNITIGVLSRVAQLADRDDPAVRREKHGFHSLIPLKELIAEINGVGVQSKQVERAFRSLILRGGPELELLLSAPIDEIGMLGGEMLAEGIRRMRAGEVHIEEGYDGEYGRISVFTEGELDSSVGGGSLFRTDTSEAAPSLPPSAMKESQREGLFGFDIREYRRMRASFKGNQVDRQAEEGEGRKGSDHGGIEEGLPLFSGALKDMVHHPESHFSSDILAGFNMEQRRAVLHGKGPALVLAGPGTGKTTVLAGRVARLVRDGVPPQSILAVTFTNRAAGEMRKRLEHMLGDPKAAGKPQISTFHALGLRILEENLEMTGRSSGFAIIDEDDRSVILSRVSAGTEYSVTDAGDLISKAKRELASVDGLEDDSDREIYVRYEEQLCVHNGFDFEDLVLLPVRMLTNRPDLLENYRERYRWVLIDEYQDINQVQYALIHLLVPEREGNIFAIGDPDQAIYGFRGADVRYIDSFLQDHPGAALYALKRSYRCSDFILRASRGVMGPGTALSAPLEGVAAGVRVHVVEQGSDRSEGEFVARTIERMMGGLRFFSMDSDIAGGYEGGTESLADFAVLCRIREQMTVVEEAFSNHSIPYQAVGTLPFYREEPFKSLGAFMRMARMGGDAPFQGRLLQKKHPPSGTQLPRLDRGVSVRDAARRIADLFFRDSIAEREALFLRYLELCERYGKDFSLFFRHLELGTGTDLYRADAEQVSLLTLHAAKGLEFSCVFIIGCEEGLIPYTLFGRGRGETDLSEERRLLYVGMTRARDSLVLSHAGRRLLFGREFRLSRSSFLDGIEEELLERSRGHERVRRREADGQLDLFTDR